MTLQYSIDLEAPDTSAHRVVVGFGPKLGGAYVASGDTLREALLKLLDNLDHVYPGWFAGHTSTTPTSEWPSPNAG